MTRGDTKKIVVLKDIPSNIIEEAIIILKTDKDLSKSTTNNNKTSKSLIHSKDFLLKEAELIIQSYINDIKKPEAVLPQACKHYNSKGLNFIINSCLIGSIIIFAYLMFRAF